MIASGVYRGTLRHRRFSPVPHEFVYPLFMVLLDVDQISALMRVSPFTSHNRFNWASFHESDHLHEASAPGLSLRQRLEEAAHVRGQQLPGGPVFLLTHLRYLGYGFNPVSFFYCYDPARTLQLVVAEVNNTFGGAHTYWLRPRLDASRPASRTPRPFRASAEKSLYVSPFLESDLEYSFALTAPADRLVAHMEVSAGAGRAGGAGEAGGAEGALFDATLSLERREWNATEIRRALVRHPVMTAKVMAGIHWQALGLWRKGVRVVPRETPNGERVDIR